MKGALW